MSSLYYFLGETSTMCPLYQVAGKTLVELYVGSPRLGACAANHQFPLQVLHCCTQNGIHFATRGTVGDFFFMNSTLFLNSSTKAI